VLVVEKYGSCFRKIIWDFKPFFVPKKDISPLTVTLPRFGCNSFNSNFKKEVLPLPLLPIAAIILFFSLEMSIGYIPERQING
jgi:hypothetical protein